MYYVYSYAQLENLLNDDFDKSYEIWQKILSEKHGRYIDDYFIFSTEECIKIEGIVFKPNYQLKEWIKTLCCDSHTNIYEGLDLEHSDIMSMLLDDLDDDTLTDDEQYPTYSDLIFYAEDPKEKVYDLLVEYAEILLNIKKDEMEKAFKKVSDGIKDRSIMLY